MARCPRSPQAPAKGKVETDVDRFLGKCWGNVGEMLMEVDKIDQIGGNSLMNIMEKLWM